MKLCTATKIYLVFTILTLLYLIIQNSVSNIGLLLRIFAFGIWAYIISYLCTSGYASVATVSAIVPHIIFILLTIRPDRKSMELVPDA